jgi:hypothetical protein
MAKGGKPGGSRANVSRLPRVRHRKLTSKPPSRGLGVDKQVSRFSKNYIADLWYSMILGQLCLAVLVLGA